MIHYTISILHPHRHFIQFRGESQSHGRTHIRFQLPAWRPGRYELGNFSKNIRAWKAYNAEGQALAFQKLTKDVWEVQTQGSSVVEIRYEYYAAELNAGSSYLDQSQLYINPVNCFFYDSEHEQTAYRCVFELPADYTLACGLQKESAHVLLASNFDELADSPLIASATLQHLTYTSHDIPVHIWIQGQVKLDMDRLVQSFQLFTDEQIQLFEGMPCSAYHFLFHFTPHFLRHGVEHHNSTVIAMGPASEFQQESLFHDLLGISCHELFHTWNIKSIRPKEMMPYDYTKENYSRLGYVAEGVTTYYGDLHLWTTGLIHDNEWFDHLNEAIQNYFDNPGRHNHSVADSSFDTWLDGYGAGIPWRKVSIYNEGSLIALICDLLIIRHSQGMRNLDHTMRTMYKRFGEQGIGYTEADYKQAIEEAANTDFSVVFDTLVNGCADYGPVLAAALETVGLEIKVYPGGKYCESRFGFSVEETAQKVTITNVHPNTPADDAALWMGDEIVAVNGTSPYKNFQNLLKMQVADPIELTILRKNKLMRVQLSSDGQDYMRRYRLEYAENRSAEHKEHFHFWRKRR